VASVSKHPVIRALFSLALVMAVGAVFNADGAFFQWDTHRDMLRQVSVFGILACGMTMVIITGGIDSPEASQRCAVVFSSSPSTWDNRRRRHRPRSCWAACGALRRSDRPLRVQPFIATLAMVFRAAGKLLSGDRRLHCAPATDGSPVCRTPHL
jgi:ribose transport system permease protein